MIGLFSSPGPLIGAFAAFGALFGFIQAYEGNLIGNDTNTDALSSAPNVNDRAKELLDSIAASNGIELNEDGSTVDPNADPEDGNSKIDENALPRIIATAELDGKTTATFKLADGSLMSASAGDELPGGWRLTTVSITQIIAQKGEIQETVSLLGGASDETPNDDVAPEGD